jgi:hypothetical protein
MHACRVNGVGGWAPDVATYIADSFIFSPTQS